MMRLILMLTLLAASVAVSGEEIGSVDTTFKLVGPDNKIVVEAFDDPNVEGVACHLSRAKKGGVSGALGVAEDPSDASIACRQIGPIRITQDLQDGKEIFSKRTSLLFKELHVARFWDEKRNVLIYLVYSDKVIKGSRKNAITTVAIRPWGTQEPVISGQE